MAAASDFLELELLDHLTGKASWTAPTNVYLKLYLASPADDDTGAAALETTRKVMSFAVAAAGAISTNAAMDWTSVSTTETYSHFGIFDTVGPTGGNMLVHGALDSAVAVTATDNFSIASGDLTITLT